MSGDLVPVDPVLLVWAARGLLGHRGSHAPAVVAATIRRAADLLPAPVRAALARDLTGWLDGPGAVAPWDERAPWVAALAALGVTRAVVRAETPGLPPRIPGPRRPVSAEHRRRTDVRRPA